MKPRPPVAAGAAQLSPEVRSLLAFARANNLNPTPNPLPPRESVGLRMWRWRDRGDELVELPRSVRVLLVYDRDLCLRPNRPFFAALFERCGDDGVITSPTMTEVCAGDGQIGHGFVPRGNMRWVDGPDMPGLLEFPLGGDQRVFLYMGAADDDGEYPIARFDNQPEVWLTSGCLADEVLEGLPGAEARKAAAEARNQRWLKREWLA